jgi:hypothetical protein
MFEAIKQSETFKAWASVPDFESMLPRATHGFFMRHLESEKAEIESLRRTLAAFGYNA